MYKIIGKGGCAFKAITHQTKSDYIYWLKPEGLIAIYGFDDEIQEAALRIEERIYMIENNDMSYDKQFPKLSDYIR
jgi:hypothetical protein